MRSVAFVTVLACIVVKAAAQSPVWGQCGGTGWTGSTDCTAGSVCTTQNDYYSQCIPDTTPPSTTAASTGPTAAPSVTSTVAAPAPTGTQIRADQDPVFHLYLQNLKEKPVLGPEFSSGYFIIGKTITLNTSDGTQLFLNENESASTSYKTLTLDKAASTTDWGLEGDTIITTSPRQLNFLACTSSTAGFYDLYLQEGNDTPSGSTCSLISLHLPCLC